MENQQTLLLGDKLKHTRESLKLSVDDVAYQTRIPVKYLSWLEAGNYKNLPADVYVRGFIIKYAKALDLEQDDLLKLYFQESEAFNKIRSKKNVVPTLKYPRLVVTPRIIAMVVGLMFFVGVFGYFGWQIYFLMRPPQVVLQNMGNDFVTYEEHHLLKGSVSGANSVTINNKPVNFNERGEFSEPVSLSEGLNVVELKAENRFGKSTTVIRKIIYNK